MNNLQWIALGLLAALGGAGVTVFGKLGLEGVSSTLATALRAVIMALVMLVVALGTGQLGALLGGKVQLSGRAWLLITLAGLSGAGSWLAYFAALRVGPAAGVAALDRLSLALIFLFSALVLREPHTWRGWVGMLVLLTGVYLMASDR
ncbi:EamA family transporter [Deinococcus geothermalis]|uniref:EamA family transporter n=1 Tax=Deinococcus geothermalis TaxID=68909 RepID=UPI00235783A6|nr:EamA family transporter [Deinococcus geothermalis]